MRTQNKSHTGAKSNSSKITIESITPEEWDKLLETQPAKRPMLSEAEAKLVRQARIKGLGWQRIADLVKKTFGITRNRDTYRTRIGEPPYEL